MDKRSKLGGGGKHALDNNAVIGYALKADIRHYFETVDHSILLTLIRKKIKDEKVIWLIETILNNHKTEVSGNSNEKMFMVGLEPGAVQVRGMPLGNMTSQFFANVYLNELDYFVKHRLKAKYYIRYVDDFVILHRDRNVLEKWKNRINSFLKNRLELEIHPEKSRVIPLKRGTTLLGFRIFYNHRLLKKSNAQRMWKRLEKFKKKYEEGKMSREEMIMSLEGWLAYAEFANIDGFANWSTLIEMNLYLTRYKNS